MNNKVRVSNQAVFMDIPRMATGYLLRDTFLQICRQAGATAPRLITCGCAGRWQRRSDPHSSSPCTGQYRCMHPPSQRKQNRLPGSRSGLHSFARELHPGGHHARRRCFPAQRNRRLPLQAPHRPDRQRHPLRRPTALPLGSDRTIPPASRSLFSLTPQQSRSMALAFDVTSVREGLQ